MRAIWGALRRYTQRFMVDMVRWQGTTTKTAHRRNLPARRAANAQTITMNIRRRWMVT